VVRERLPSYREPASRDPQTASQFIGIANTRTVSPSLYTRSASGVAACFLLASALLLHEALRLHDAEDARCVQPTSATRTTCVHPHLARSRLAAAAFAVADAPRSLRLHAA
jgi:hypothetical protein